VEKLINLYRENNCWAAEFRVYRSGAWMPDLAIVDLFGTHIIPTAFTAQAHPHTVLAHIRQHNPDAVVRLRDA